VKNCIFNTFFYEYGNNDYIIGPRRSSHNKITVQWSIIIDCMVILLWGTPAWTYNIVIASKLLL